MGAPSINISFIEKAITVSTRGKSGVVMLLVKDTLEAPAVNPITVALEGDIPSTLSDPTKEQIKMALIGYVNKPKKVLVFCMGIANDAEENKVTEKYEAAKAAIETIKFDYLAIPTVQTDGKGTEIAEWVKTMREKKKKTFKVVLPNIAGDHEGVINYSIDKNIKTILNTEQDGSKTAVDIVYTAEQYCSRIAGLIAGTPLTISCTYAQLPDLSNCTRLNDIDAPVDEGKFIVFHDGEKVKVVRGVNSLVTTKEGKGDNFKKIKIVDAMDLINDDLTKLAQDNYLGKFPNSYNNKCILMTAFSDYFKQLLKDGIISSYTVDIDVEEQAKYLQSRGIDTSEMTEEEIRVADTGTKVFLVGNVKILDAIEDIAMPIYI